MYESIALFDRVAAVMPPEELNDLWVLVDFAEEHGFNEVELLKPVVGEYDAQWIYDVLLRFHNGVVAQQVTAGLDERAWTIIEEAYLGLNESDPVARWIAAVKAADTSDMACMPWAAVADVAAAMEWPLPEDAYVRLCRTAPEQVVRAATAAKVLMVTGDVEEAWDAATGSLTREVR